MDEASANRCIGDLPHMQTAARRLSPEDLDGRVDGRGDLASLLGGRRGSALSRR